MRGLAVVLLTGCGFQLSSPAGIDAREVDAANDAAIDASGPLASPRRLRFDNTASADDLMGFPVLVALTPQTIDYDLVTDPATELRFADPDTGTDLPFEVERWDPTGESIVWVRVPQINSASANDSILMHFGVGANGAPDPVGVWTSHELVAHFDPAYASSTGTHDGSPIAMALGTGQIARAAALPGGGNHGVQWGQPAALFNGWQQFTLEFWIYGDYPSPLDVTGRSFLMDKGASLNLGRFYVATPGGISTLVLQIDMHFTGGIDTFLNTSITPQAWTYIVYTFDGSALRLHANGVEVSNQLMPSAQQLVADATDFYIGSPNSSFAGAMDELRIAQVPRSASWVRAQYLSMTRAFVMIGDP